MCAIFCLEFGLPDAKRSDVHQEKQKQLVGLALYLALRCPISQPTTKNTNEQKNEPHITATPIRFGKLIASVPSLRGALLHFNQCYSHFDYRDT